MGGGGGAQSWPWPMTSNACLFLLASLNVCLESRGKLDACPVVPASKSLPAAQPLDCLLFCGLWSWLEPTSSGAEACLPCLPS